MLRAMSRLHTRSYAKLAVLTAIAVAAAGVIVDAPDAHAAGADLVLSATQPPNPLAPSQSFTSVFTLTNAGDADSAASTVVVSYPKAVSGSGVTRSVTKGAGLTCSTYAPRYGSIRMTCTVGVLPPGASAAIAKIKNTGPATVPFAGINTSASGTGPTNSASAVWQWRGTGNADLTIGASTTPNPVIAGRSATTTVSMTNAGYSSANGFATHVNVPGIVTSVAPSTTASATCLFSGGDVDCTTDIANGGYLALTIVYDTTTTPGAYLATATADVGDLIVETNELNNAATSTVNVTGAVVVLTSSTANAPTVDRGSVFVRHIAITNSGSADALSVTFSDSSKQVGFVSAVTPVGGSCAAWYVTQRFNRRVYNGTTCSIGVIAAGTTAVVDITYSVAATATLGGFANTVNPSTASFRDPTVSGTSSGTTTIVQPSGAIAPTNLAAPIATGNTNTGSTLSTTNGTWVGTATITYSYQWQTCNALGTACTDIPGATAATYTITNAEVGFTLRGVVTATNGGGVTSAATAVTALVQGAVGPLNVTAPALLAGLEKQPGFAWGVTTGSWSGTPTITFTYQWLRCNVGGGGCIAIAGATNSSYVLTTADVFHSVQVRVTAANTAGNSSALSDVSAEIDPFG